MAQISFNLLDFDVTPVHVAYESVVEEAKKLNLAVVGSEIVGLVPLGAMKEAAEYYMEQEGLFLPDEGQQVRLAVERMGFNSCAPFEPSERIIEWMCKDADAEPLASLSVRGFVEELGARSAAPGGGSAAAVAASMGAGLGAMVGWMTYGSRKWEDLDATMRRLIGPLDEAMKQLIPTIDADTARQDSAEHFSRLDAQLFTAMAWIFIPTYCFAIP